MKIIKKNNSIEIIKSMFDDTINYHIYDYDNKKAMFKIKAFLNGKQLYEQDINLIRMFKLLMDALDNKEVNMDEYLEINQALVDLGNNS